MVVALLISAAVVCLGLCVYGVNAVIRRGKTRRDDAHALTHQ